MALENQKAAPTSTLPILTKCLQRHELADAQRLPEKSSLRHQLCHQNLKATTAADEGLWILEGRGKAEPLRALRNA